MHADIHRNNNEQGLFTTHASIVYYNKKHRALLYIYRLFLQNMIEVIKIKTHITLEKRTSVSTGADYPPPQFLALRFAQLCMPGKVFDNNYTKWDAAAALNCILSSQRLKLSMNACMCCVQSICAIPCTL